MNEELDVVSGNIVSEPSVGACASRLVGIVGVRVNLQDVEDGSDAEVGVH